MEFPQETEARLQRGYCERTGSPKEFLMIRIVVAEIEQIIDF